MGGFHSRKDQVSKMLKRMLLLVVGMFLMGCAEDGDSVAESNGSLNAVGDRVSGVSQTSETGMLASAQLVTILGSVTKKTKNTTGQYIRLYTSNTAMKLVTVFKTNGSFPPNGTYYDSSDTAIVSVTLADFEKIDAALKVGSQVAITYDYSLESTNSTNATSFLYDWATIALSIIPVP